MYTHTSVHSSCNILFIAGELYVVTLRGLSSVPFAGSLIQIVDPSLCVW